MSFVGNNRTVTVRKDALLKKLKEGLLKHETRQVQHALDYREAAVAFLAEALERAKAGDLSDIRFGLTQPESHVKDFERAISMIEMSVESEIQLDEDTFKKWILGEWSWARDFELSASAIGGYLHSKGLK